jgi:hypothetical protein
MISARARRRVLPKLKFDWKSLSKLLPGLASVFSLFVLLLVTTGRATANPWTVTSVPRKVWLFVTCSANGNNLAAAARDGSIYTSTNSGITWRSNAVPALSWSSLSASADGSKLVAVAFQKYWVASSVYVSTNWGATWGPMNAPSTNWTCITCSGDGKRLAAAAISGAIYISADAGNSWTVTTAPVGPWKVINCSADGTKLMATGFDPDTFSLVAVSGDAGATWSSYTFQTWCLSAACSAIGSPMMVATYGTLGAVFESFDSGATWTQTSLPSGVQWWESLACSADGTRWAAAINHSYSGNPTVLYLSSDSGASWMPAEAPITNWSSIASSADGGKWVAAVGGYDNHPGLIYLWQNMSLPSLHIRTSGNTNILSWTIPAVNFVLQQNPDLSSTNWTDVASDPIPDYATLQNEVRLPNQSGRLFYRLVQDEAGRP